MKIKKDPAFIESLYVVSCAVGTKVLCDGDVVEVDAERGIVRKLDKQ